MGFVRETQPIKLDPVTRAAIRSAITHIAVNELAFVPYIADPFGVAYDCINPAGHEPIASCGAVVCRHCARIF